MTEFIKNKFEEIWDRIKEETPLKNLTELAEITGITQSALSKAKGRNDFSASWAYAVGKKFGLLTEWIMTGKGPKKIEELPQERRFEMLNEFEEWLSEEVLRNPERKIWFELHLLDSFQKFAKWKLQRDEQKGGEFGKAKRKVA
ncbi:MAG: helix-turn-helix domain-containing protein [Desulfobulbus sp.]|nr:helix-turn-helix domain-containing protein [Desulfobulbus sp.]